MPGSENGSPPAKKGKTEPILYTKEEYQQLHTKYEQVVEKYINDTKYEQLCNEYKNQCNEYKKQCDKLRESEVERAQVEAELNDLRKRYMKTAGLMHVRGAFEEMLFVSSTEIQKAFGHHSWQSQRPSKEQQFGAIVERNVKDFKKKLLDRKTDLKRKTDFELKEWVIRMAEEVYSKESRLIHQSNLDQTIEIDNSFTAEQIAFIRTVCDCLNITTIVQVPLVAY